jgi:IS30 family transposase
MMYGDLLVILLKDINLMLHLLMIIVNSLGYSCLSTKSEVFQKFQNHVEKLFNKKILPVQSNWGREYQRLNAFFQQIDISHHVSCPYAHQQNGPADRKHRHIVEVGLSLLAHGSVPLKYWDEAFLAATYLINLLPTKILDFSSPLERLFSKKTQLQWIENFWVCLLAKFKTF